MRLSYSDQLIGLDQQRRAKAYGREAKRFHLKLVIFASALSYLAARVAAWIYPKSVSHTWVDDVLVEVVEDDGLERVCSIFGCVFTASLFFFLFLTIRADVRRNFFPPSRGSRAAGERGRRVKGWSESFSSLAVPASTIFGALPKADGPTATAVGSAQHLRLNQYHLPQQQQSIRTEAQLNQFLSSKESSSENGGGAPLATVTAAAAASFPTATPSAPAVTSSAPCAGSVFSGPLVGGGIAAGPSDGIRVQYLGGAEKQSAAQPVDTEWAGLGILSAERSILKARRWLSDLCQELMEETAACDRWFAERQISSFDTTHCLHETIPGPRPSNSAGVGVGLPTPLSSTTPAVLRKLDALLNERQKLAGQAQNVQNFDVILHLDQRLSLEAKLDPSGTFPTASPLSVAEQQAQRQYVIKRLRAFASQKTLASYRHNHGDADVWREGFPTDAHLLIHIVRVCVDGFANYVKFLHQPMNPQQDLAIFVGDTGEPYFYVRYRSGPDDKTYATHQGVNSLFEALLIFAAIVRAYHNDSYGGIWGVMDLSQTGLLNLL
ncbi:hypothetical protein C3747_317g7 [Trypanosoma cruzi]|uniref:Transmembrane protein n=2 Tax=Trypanosoma cruzi TaxID=5693 RepID=Q4DPC0_TRYCC|nr:hypothetical protein, conserved [Trypanosoma cruzi]EAN94377.1 hypothetical protein, conserved [Trypanosoma cruzi]PWU92545.1 hypothetical protein C3747_317g7 [Trypanosoma cruzi]|eukprot:XP_816228.1 hypothetical protein [Trypanosoma cruzi strain CL Brener]